jgi:hypothetical protein
MSFPSRLSRPVAVLATLAAALSANAIAPAASHAAPPKKKPGKAAAGGTVIRRPDLGLTFTLPSSYHVAPEEQRQAVATEAQFFAIGPSTNRQTRGSTDTLMYKYTTMMYSTISVAVLPSPAQLPEGADLSTMPKEAEDELKRTLEQAAGRRYANFHVENSARGRVAGEGAYFVAAVSDVPGSELSFRHRTCILLHNQKLYFFVFVTDLESFPAQAPAFERLLASIKWDPAKPAAKPVGTMSAPETR